VEQPPLIESTPAPPVLEKKRYHDLDALRASAMLLGIVLHGILAFGEPTWAGYSPQSDIHWDVPAVIANAAAAGGAEAPDTFSPYNLCFTAIHGFRMPLFFVVSGFFTAMLWRTRGIKELLKHRAKRILLPMVIFTPIAWITILGGMGIGASVLFDDKGVFDKPEDSKSEGALPLKNDSKLEGPLKKFKYQVYYQRFNALPDFDRLKPEFSGESEEGTIDLGLAKRKEGFGMVFDGELEIKEAGEFNFRLGSDDGSRLIINGKELIDNGGMHAVEYKKESLKLEPGMASIRVEYFDSGGAQGLSLSVSGPGMDELSSGSDELLLSKEGGKGEGEEFMKEASAWYEENLGGAPGWVKPIVIIIGIIGGIFFAGGIFPAFHHLWFLYYLVWMVIGFALVVWIAKKRKMKPWPAWVVASPLRWLWLVPLTLVPQLCFWQSFGPDTFTGIIPWPPKVLYYAVFFGFGALCYGHDEFEEKVGRYWYLCFLVAIPVLLFGLCWLHMRKTYGFKPEIQVVLSLCIVMYTWLMIFGCIGFSRVFFSRQSKVIRYISDSSYWLYLAHLAPLMCLQIMLSRWDIPSFPKFIFYCVFTIGILLLIYEFAVRYTFIGTLLNGKRTREKSPA